MKKYLLTGGFAAMLLLAACGNEEPETAEESTEEETTEESTEEETSESAEASESTEEETTEEETSDSEETEGSEEKAEVVKTSDGLEEPLELDTVRLDIVGAEIFSGKVTEEIEMLSDGLTAGDDLHGVLIEYNMENTSEAPRELYISQAQIITNTGEQLDSELLLVEGLQDVMKGAVKSSGKVPYYFKASTPEEIEWIDIVISPVTDGETYEMLTEEQKVRIEFN